MKEEQKDFLADAMEEIRDEYVAEAAYGGKHRSGGGVKVLAVAAAVILIAGGALWAAGRGIAGDRTSTETPGMEQPGSDSSDKTGNSEGIPSDRDVSVVYPAYTSLSDNSFDEWRELMDECMLSEEFAAALDAFSYETAGKVLEGSTENLMYSPLSLYYALAMAGYGAEGETAEEILGLLGVAERQELAEECNKLYRYFYLKGLYFDRENENTDNEKHNIVQLGNSLWVDERLHLKDDYRNDLLEKFFARSYDVNFGNPATAALMSRWIREQTYGVLEPNLDLSDDIRLAIVNTLYFYGAWDEDFREELTEKDDFTLTDGSNVKADFMHKSDHGRYRRGQDYSAAIMPTSNNCQVMFILPDEGVDVTKYFEAGALEEVFGSEDWHGERIEWSMPKVSFGSELPLNAVLQELGLQQMFTEEAQFGRTAEEPLFVSTVLQQTHIALDEKGAEGAAVTIIMDKATAAMPKQPVEMNLNRPFLFGIRDGGSGAWLFLGVCQNPAE